MYINVFFPLSMYINAKVSYGNCCRLIFGVHNNNGINHSSQVCREWEFTFSYKVNLLIILSMLVSNIEKTYSHLQVVFTSYDTFFNNLNICRESNEFASGILSPNIR